MLTVQHEEILLKIFPALQKKVLIYNNIKIKKVKLSKAENETKWQGELAKIIITT